jgi:hypothetical protein
MSNLAQYIHDACIQAVEQCPQFGTFETDSLEQVGARSIKPDDLANMGVGTVVAYWRTPQSIGGSMLWEGGYADLLSPDVRKLFEQVEVELKALIGNSYGSTIAESVNKDCIAAVEECPQFEGFDEDSYEQVKGGSVNVANLHKEGLDAVLAYWRDRDTIGGNLLWHHEYSMGLPQGTRALFKNVSKLLDQAICQAVATYSPHSA